MHAGWWLVLRLCPHANRIGPVTGRALPARAAVRLSVSSGFRIARAVFAGGRVRARAAVILLSRAVLRRARAAVMNVSAVARSQRPRFSTGRSEAAPLLGRMRFIRVEDGVPEPRDEALEGEAAVRRCDAPQTLQHTARELLRVRALPPTFDLGYVHKASLSVV